MPVGIPLALTETVPVNPFSAATVTVKLVPFPAVRVCELGEAENEKFGGGMFAATVMLTCVLLLSEPLVPPIVNVYVPAAVAVVVEMFNVEPPDPLIDAGLKLAVIPLGSPLAVSETVPVKPLRDPIVTVKLVLVPAVIDCELGEAEIVKSGGGAFAPTATLTVVLWLNEPLAPPIVSV